MSPHGLTRTKDVNNNPTRPPHKGRREICNLKIKQHILTLVLCTLSLCTFAQLNTDRITAIGRNALYFEDYVLSIQYFNQVIHLKPYLSEPGNVDYLALKLEQIHERYPVSEDKED